MLSKVLLAAAKTAALVSSALDRASELASRVHAELFTRAIARDPDFAKATDVQQTIVDECNEIRDMLVGKNAAYGNSVLDPLRIFSKADRAEQIRVRLDDKLSRIARGHASGEDVTADLIGYLHLLRISERP